ncbi:putative 2-oxoisovalerate dehydrogenase subunit alpha protein [Eutypa lata UCREL1]|uniref:2-oxoisovalerate dehydrogenase subunit alpha n=1 Tax=Eutypa lata (strain UCR-EL1) TaxID=1287681 RepID=M7T4A4_EUTLA|nr:putative 2-oxoisovalerate dehydrogenase subunit alpha protein [Eutypa lata UCREL1]
MEAKGFWNETKEREAREGIRRDVLKAFSEAEREKKPPIRAMFEDVYEELTPDLKAQMRELRDHLEKYPDEYDLSEFEGGIKSIQQ